MSDRDRVFIITGAAGGIGSVMTRALVEAGNRVIAVDIAAAAARLDTLVSGVGPRVLPLTADVTSAADAERVVSEALARFGRLDGLVNNAGLGMDIFSTQIRSQRFYQLPDDKWKQLMNVNVNGPFVMARAVAPHLIERGWGRIVNIVTSYTSMLMQGFSPYGPSKAALEAATVVWSKDLDGSGVTVNALLPGGAANTPMVPHESVPDRATLIQPTVMRAPLVWLASSRSDGVTARRFIGKDWNPDASDEDNVRVAGANAGW